MRGEGLCSWLVWVGHEGGGLGLGFWWFGRLRLR